MIIKTFRVPLTKLMFRWNAKCLYMFIFWNERMTASIRRDPITDEDRYWGGYIGATPPIVFFGWRIEYWPKDNL